MASLSDYPRVLSLAPLVSDAIDAAGGITPARLDLGWMWLESGGHVGEADTSVASLGGELGLFQLDASERSATGFTDTARMTGKDDASAVYQIQAGHALIDYYGGYVGAMGVPIGDDYWRLIKLAHGMGRGGMQHEAQGYIDTNGGAWGNWSDFEAYAAANPFPGHADDWTQHHLDNTDAVWSNGLALAVAANLVPAVAGGADSIGGWIPVAAALGLLGAGLWAVSK